MTKRQGQNLWLFSSGRLISLIVSAIQMMANIPYRFIKILLNE